MSRVYHVTDCWCGMDHSRMEMDEDGNWYEVEDEMADDSTLIWVDDEPVIWPKKTITKAELLELTQQVHARKLEGGA